VGGLRTYRGVMRRSWSLAALALLILVLTGCQLHDTNKSCANEPGVAGGGTSVCTKPPPSQFNQMGQ